MYIKSSFPDPVTVSDCNAYDALWSRLEQAEWPQDIVLHIDGKNGRKRTYQEFRTRVLLSGTALGGSTFDGFLGISSDNGEMIAITSRSSLDYAVLVHSLLLLATPFALFDPSWTPFEFENALKLAKPTRLFVEDQLLPTLLPIAESMGVKNIYVLGEKTEGRKSFDEMVEEARLRAIAPLPTRAVAKNTLAYLMFSSGTTGLPKAVMISHGNIIANLNKGRIRRDLGPNSVGSAQQHNIPVHLVRGSMCFVSGLSSCCFYPFIAPATCVIVTDRSIEATLDTIARYHVTVARFHPSFIRQLVDSPLLKDADMSSLQLVLTAGSYFSPELLAKMAVAIPHEFYFGQAYGMTESPSIAILQPQPIILGKTNYHVVESVGMLFPGVEARILKEDGSEANVDEVGELYIRSETVALGYWKNEKATRETFVDNWLRTGDVFRVDQNGCFFISGRVKDTFKTPSGFQLSPFEIEDTLLSEPQGLIADVIVAGVIPGPNSEDRKIPRAWIVLSEEGKKLGADAVIRELEGWYQKRLSSYKWLHGGIEIVDEIPKASSGKVLRAVLQKKYDDRVIEKVGSGDA